MKPGESYGAAAAAARHAPSSARHEWIIRAGYQTKQRISSSGHSRYSSQKPKKVFSPYNPQTQKKRLTGRLRPETGFVINLSIIDL